MKTKRIITENDVKNFFKSSINTFNDAIGTITLNISDSTVMFDFNAALLLSFDSIYADIYYVASNSYFDKDFLNIINNCISNDVNEKTSFSYSHNINDQMSTFIVKVEIHKDHYKLYFISIDKLMKTEKQLSLISDLIGTGVSMFTGSIWWNDYDISSEDFFQSDSGPKILGVPISENKLYSKKEFQKVRDNTKVVSPFYEEAIVAEGVSYERLYQNKTDYFGGRTPALSASGEIIWVEAYGKCFLRYPNGKPRFVLAIDVYMSEVFERINQLEILNNLTDYGLIGSQVGVWYHQRHFSEGRYYFTESYQKLMAGKQQYRNVSFTNILNEQIEICKNNGKGYEEHLLNFRKTHNSIFTKGLDKYHLIIPNYKEDSSLQWIEVRGNVIERDNEGNVILFVGINVDVTESENRNLELERLRVKTERLQLAEKLAVKARDIMVWYLEPGVTFEDRKIHGNEVFFDKLGLPKNKEGVIHFKDLYKTLVTDDEYSEKLASYLVAEIKKLIAGSNKSMKQVLAKHQNIQTGEIIYLEHSIEIAPSSYDKDVRVIGGVLLDVTDSILYQEQIKYLANHDTLTNTYNRNYFEEFISNKLPDSYSVLIFDLDGLKLINDAFGHIEGDRIIKLVANLLKDIFYDCIFVSRIGGDEFVVLTEYTDYDEVTDKANLLEDALEEYNKNNAIEVNVSKGGVVVKDNDMTFDKAFVQAENIMYRRKLNSRSSRKAKVLESILETLNAKTEETKDHSDRLSINAVKTLAAINHTRSSEVEDIELLALVHDIGKITIPDDILHKSGKLTSQEYEIIKKHCEAGYKIIRNITDSDEVCNGVLFHHERWDGKGYPQGLKGEDIPLFARVINVVDSFDAMTHDRIYQPAISIEDAIKELRKHSGTQFDPKIVEAFLRSCLEIK